MKKLILSTLLLATIALSMTTPIFAENSKSSFRGGYQYSNQTAPDEGDLVVNPEKQRVGYERVYIAGGPIGAVVQII